MNAIKTLLAVSVMTLVVSTAAVAGQSIGYVSAEAVVVKDKKVSRIQRSLVRDAFQELSTVTNTIYYIVEPTETTYKTAETVITMVNSDSGDYSLETEYAYVHVSIMYNKDESTYSAGNVWVEYKTVY